MFDNNEKDLFNGEGMDLGNDIDAAFEDFKSVDDIDISSIFGDATSSGTAENITKEDSVGEPAVKTVETATETTAAAVEQMDIGNVENVTLEPETPETKTEVKQNEVVTVTNETKSAQTNDAKREEPKEPEDYFAQAVAAAEDLQAESTKNSLTEKLPVFVYGNAKEEIVDTSKTFDELRIEKSDDFPILDDYSAVSWKVTYGSISKTVPTPKKTTIVSMKKEIEESKDFVKMLKKSKSDVVCKITPIVETKSKGVVASYKGVAKTLDEAKTSGKVISFVPSDDGCVYEVRKNAIGTFIAKAGNVTILDKVRAGFSPALPKIPYETLAKVISFFRSFISKGYNFEALAYIYWSVQDSKYFVYIPKQSVSSARISSVLPDIDQEQFVLVMEIHSHHTMPAVFSQIDNKDERDTRLYTVVGSLDCLFPDINVRCAVGQAFVSVNACDVFEYEAANYPSEWTEAVDMVKEAEI